MKWPCVSESNNMQLLSCQMGIQNMQLCRQLTTEEIQHNIHARKNAQTD